MNGQAEVGETIIHKPNEEHLDNSIFVLEETFAYVMEAMQGSMWSIMEAGKKSAQTAQERRRVLWGRGEVIKMTMVAVSWTSAIKGGLLEIIQAQMEQMNCLEESSRIFSIISRVRESSGDGI